jgi:CYTH domain-containing protein
MAGGLEIERKYLLRAMPEVSRAWTRVEIEQGYFDAAHVPAAEDPAGIEHIREGRLRRTVAEDGSVTCTHTIKRGMGLVRAETEQELTIAQFRTLWPGTEGMRLRKTRWMRRDGEALWAIDRFLDLQLVLAEVELPTESYLPQTPLEIAAVLVREVTLELEYVNSAIARCLRRAGRRVAAQGTARQTQRSNG